MLATRGVTCQGGDVTFTFVGGNLALDLVGTVAERRTSDHEQLSSNALAAQWFVAAGLLDQPPAVDDSDRQRMLGLREAVYRLVGATVAGEPLRRADLSVLNAAAAPAPPEVRVTPAGRVRRRGDAAAALSVVARSFADLLDQPDGLLRWCEGDACTRPFVDRSRGHRRRWCGMAGCGDRAKAAAYRARQRSAATGS
jgi:predicted RNA-binding Zn ribbon-like protein